MDNIVNFMKKENIKGYTVLNVSKLSSGHKKYKIRHECGYEYTTTFNHFITMGRRCPKCMNGASQTLDELKKKVYDIKGTEYEILSDTYNNSQTKILFKHNICGKTFEMRPANFISNNHAMAGESGNRCPHCFGHIRKTTEIFKKEVYDRVGDEYIVLGEYTSNSNKILMQHNTDYCHNKFEIRPKDFLKKNGNRCPKCRSSKGELNSIKWFTENNINFEHKCKINNCKNILPLEFDFKVYKNDDTFILYEFDGRLHFEPWDNGEESLEHLKRQQENDIIKNNFCKENNITLIRITYMENLEERLNELFNLNDYRKDNSEMNE